MSTEKRFGRRIVVPSTAEIVHEMKLMALRQSLDAALEREARAAGEPAPPLPSDVSHPVGSP